ncbi:MAG: hypothetical protein P4M07_28470 [Xanthobacteraceae bacterium]|nr:hypothetical protein [Xanthobacteraceae bacterium]
MVSRNYLIKQAATLLRMARTSRDEKVSLGLTAKAAEMTARIESKTAGTDQGLRAPDVEPED